MSLVVDRLKEIETVDTIQGNIASGKTTLINEIEAYIDTNNLSALNQSTPIPPSVEGQDLILILHEPVTQWCKKNCTLLNSKGEGENTELYSFLELFYKGMKATELPNNNKNLLSVGLIILIIIELVVGFVIGHIITAVICGAIATTLCALIVVLQVQKESTSPSSSGKTPHINKFALDFQLFTFTTRTENFCQQLAKLPKYDPASNVRVHIISERSLRSDRLFFKNIYDSGAIPEYQWQVYEQLHRTVCGATLKSEDTMIRINTTAVTCYKRMYEKRQREAEVDNGVTLEYLQSLEKQHEDMYASFITEKGKQNLIDVNFEQDMTKEQIATLAASIVERIRNSRRK